MIIQSALLLTYWHETPDSPRDFHYWLGRAFSLATSIGLQDLVEAEPSRENRLGRRLWWCLYTRDRINAMNLCRHTIIPEESYTTTLPTLGDFMIGVFPEVAAQMFDSCDVLRSPYQQAQLAAIFIEKARLCTIISHIITPSPDEAAISRCTDLLDAWRADLPYYIEHQSLPSTSLTLSDIEKPTFAYRAWLSLVFLNALSALHRHQTRRRGSHTAQAFSFEAALHEPSDGQIQPAIQSIAAIVEELYRVDVVHYLPTTTVGLLLPVLATQMSYIRSGQGPDMWIAGF